MRLADYLRGKPTADRQALAVRCGTTWGHLKNIAYAGKPCSVKLAVALERETDGHVGRRDLRPDDWAETWPELALSREHAAIERVAT